MSRIRAAGSSRPGGGRTLMPGATASLQCPGIVRRRTTAKMQWHPANGPARRPRNSARRPRNSARRPRNSARRPRNSARRPRNSARYANRSARRPRTSARYANRSARRLRTSARYANRSARRLRTSARYAGRSARYAGGSARYAGGGGRRGRAGGTGGRRGIRARGETADTTLGLVKPPPISNTGRKRRFRERHPGYDGRLHRKRDAAAAARVETLAVSAAAWRAAPVADLQEQAMLARLQTLRRRHAAREPV